jgi:thiamine pyrophosphate-dependent acetolactate synthase large subunit-like protein
VLHELKDQCALMTSVTGFAASARSAAEAGELLRAAFAALRAPRARPAYLDLPLDLLPEMTTLRPEVFAAPAAFPAPPDAALAAAAQLLEHARRPLIIAGGGARAAGGPLRQLVEALDAYLVTTCAAKGVLAETHPANLGTSLPYAPVQELAANADVVVAVGTEIAETDVYTSTQLPLGGQLVRIDVDAGKLADHFGAAVRIQGDATASLAALAAGMRPRCGWRSAAGSAAAYRERIEARFGATARAGLAALRAIRTALPSDAAVFSDMTQLAYLGNYAFRAERPGLWFHPSGYGTLGFALPAAIGAKIAQPERAIVALAGDFGLQFTFQELMSAVELDLTLPIIIWNNEALGQIRDDMRAAGIAPIGVVGRNPDFVALASACGAAGARAHSPQELARQLQAALARSGPTLVEAVAADFRTPT